MPRSRNPHAYPVWVSALFSKLTNPRCESEITIAVGEYKRASAMRHMFYSYVVAKERQGKHDPQVLDDCAMARRYLIRIAEQAGIWVLIIKDRNTDQDALDILDQVMMIGEKDNNKSENLGANSQLPPSNTDDNLTIPPDLDYVDPDTKWSNTIGNLFKRPQ